MLAQSRFGIDEFVNNEFGADLDTISQEVPAPVNFNPFPGILIRPLLLNIKEFHEKLSSVFCE
jgi:hypothetical protein